MKTFKSFGLILAAAAFAALPALPAAAICTAQGLDLMRNLAPAAPMRTYDNAFFFSDRVDPHSLRYQLATGNWDIGALALK